MNRNLSQLLRDRNMEIAAMQQKIEELQQRINELENTDTQTAIRCLQSIVASKNRRILELKEKLRK